VGTVVVGDAMIDFRESCRIIVNLAFLSRSISLCLRAFLHAPGSLIFFEVPSGGPTLEQLQSHQASC